MAQLYAWTNVSAGDKSAKYGEVVTASKLGISKEQFDAHVESGAFRTTKPPDLPETWQGSPVDYLRQQADQAGEDAAALAAYDVVEEKEEEEAEGE